MKGIISAFLAVILLASFSYAQMGGGMMGGQKGEMMEQKGMTGQQQMMQQKGMMDQQQMMDGMMDMMHQMSTMMGDMSGMMKDMPVDRMKKMSEL